MNNVLAPVRELLPRPAHQRSLRTTAALCIAVRSARPTSMGLDVGNDFGQFHLNWAGTRWFRQWCQDEGLSDPFIGWVSGDNSGDQCVLGPDNVHTGLARVWCRGLEKKHPELAKLGNKLIANQRTLDLYAYLYPNGRLGKGLGAKEWERRAPAAWYAILKYGIKHDDILEYC